MFFLNKKNTFKFKLPDSKMLFVTVLVAAGDDSVNLKNDYRM